MKEKVAREVLTVIPFSLSLEKEDMVPVLGLKNALLLLSTKLKHSAPFSRKTTIVYNSIFSFLVAPREEHDVIIQKKRSQQNNQHKPRLFYSFGLMKKEYKKRKLCTISLTVKKGGLYGDD